MGMTFGSATTFKRRRGATLDLAGGARVCRSAMSLLGHLDGIARFSEPYYADAARAGVLLERVPAERRMEAALEWSSRNGRIV